MIKHKRMMNLAALKILLLIMIPMITISLSGCGQKNQTPKPQLQSAQDEQESDKVPDQLKDLENNIEEIIKTLNGPAVSMKDEEKSGQDGKSAQQDQGQKEESKGDEKSQGQESQGKGQQEGGGGKESEEGGSGQEEEKQGGKQNEKQGGGQEQSTNQAGGAPKTTAKQKPADPFATITPIINKMHYQWNSYMPMAVKMNASKLLLDNFSTALNSLTNTIIGKNKTNTLLAASYLYTYIPDFYSLYKTSSSPEIKRVRHYTRNAMLNAMTTNWTQAESDLNNLKSSWTLYKSTLGKEQQELSNQLDFSIDELNKVTKEKNQPLVDIKGRVSMANIQALEKASKEESEKGSQGGGGQDGGGEQKSS